MNGTLADSPVLAEPERTRTAYEATTRHWQHAETERWAILYNFLMASTILLLAWATVYASGVEGRVVVLSTLSLCGIVASALWREISARANMFIRSYGELAGGLEKSMGLKSVGPFAVAETVRDAPTGVGAMLGHRIFSARFVQVVPLVFAVLFGLLFLIPLPSAAKHFAPALVIVIGLAVGAVLVLMVLWASYGRTTVPISALHTESHPGAIVSGV